jgi:predicted aldo/keto reductase-like oxidoreductase
MLYRHFPKIANKEISVLALSLAGVSGPEKTGQMLRTASDQGINLLETGSDPARIVDLAAIQQSCGLKDAFFRVIACPAQTRNELEQFLSAIGAQSDDFLVLSLAEKGACSRLEKEGVLAAAEKAMATGRIGHTGFSCPPESALITEAVDGFPAWDFYRIDYSYLKKDLKQAIAYAAEHELGFIAGNPFADGLLDNPPPQIHWQYLTATVPRSNEEWALRAIWELQENISVSFSAKNLDQLVTNTIFAAAGRPNSLTRNETAVLSEAIKQWTESRKPGSNA